MPCFCKSTTAFLVHWPLVSGLWNDCKRYSLQDLADVLGLGPRFKLRNDGHVQDTRHRPINECGGEKAPGRSRSIGRCFHGIRLWLRTCKLVDFYGLEIVSVNDERSVTHSDRPTKYTDCHRTIGMFWTGRALLTD